jgi:signal transduction histidine kinase
VPSTFYAVGCKELKPMTVTAQDPVSGEGETRGRILVVDDDPDFLAGLCNFLFLQGFEVEAAPDADEALRIVENFDAQVAIIDFRLGSTIGLDLVAPLKRRRPDISCLLSTAYADMESAVAALRSDIYDYFRKPFHTDELVASLERCFEKIRLKTEMRAAAEALSRAKRMEAVAQVAGGVAHHFNNMLTVIQGHLDLLETVQPLHAEQFQSVETARQAVRRAVKINRSLLTFTSQMLLRPEVLDLEPWIHRVVEGLRREFGSSVVIETRFRGSLGNIEVDPVQLEAALIGLVRNAVEAMAGGGTLRIGLAPVVKDVGDGHLPIELPPGEYAMLSVTDHGAGMAPDIAERAFEPFFSSRGLAEKVGLGLSTIYGFARQSGGHLVIDSKAGGGTTVSLYLPTPTHRNGRASASG